MMPESEWMAQARRALSEGRMEDAQGILVNVVVSEPQNDQAWVLLAEALPDPERKLACLERAQELNPRNQAILRAMQKVQADITGATPGTASDERGEHDGPEQAEALLQTAEALANAVVMTTEPIATRNVGLELIRVLDQVRSYDATRARRWATSAGRNALVKYEKAVTTLIINLPQNDPQMTELREQRQRALDLFR